MDGQTKGSDPFGSAVAPSEQTFSFHSFIEVKAPNIEEAVRRVERRLKAVGVTLHDLLDCLNTDTDQEWDEAELLAMREDVASDC